MSRLTCSRLASRPAPAASVPPTARPPTALKPTALALAALACAGWIAVLALASPAPTWAASGGPDANGYRWRDSAGGCPSGWPGFSGGQQDLGFVTTMQGPFALGFTMPFVGLPVNQVWVSPHGYVTFSDQGPTTGVLQTLPDPAAPSHLFAPHWVSLERALVTIEARPGVFHVEWFQQRTTAPSASWQLHLLIFDDGSFRIHYGNNTVDGNLTIGYENATGAAGHTFLRRIGGSDTQRDATFPNPINTSVCVTPPPGPNCSGAIPISCGDAIASSTPAAPSEPAGVNYSCSGTPQDANERVFHLSLVEPSVLDTALTGLGGRDLRIFLLGACDTGSCLAGNGTALADLLLDPGDYYIVVDGPTAAAHGDFTLSVDCSPLAAPLACGASVNGDTTAGRTFIGAHSCRAGDYSGRESYYLVNHPGGTLLALLAGDPALDVFLYDANDTTTCLAGGDDSAAAFGLPAGDYLVVVDGPPGSEGPFTLDVTCGVQADCSVLEPQVLTCGSSVAGSTTGAAANVRRYACSDGDFPGPERVYELQVPPGTADVTLELITNDDLRLFLLETCDEGDCVSGGGRLACRSGLAPGSYRVLVDGPDPAGGDYTVQVGCNMAGSFERWIACTNPRTTGGAPGCGISNPWPTTAATTAARMWSLADGAFCISNPGHKAHQSHYLQGRDCQFAMYVVAECGTQMTIPLCDNETGDMRIWDVFKEEYVWLTGTGRSAACPWTQEGTRIQWQDCAGTDCRWNNVVTTISFDGDPTLCGVFRVEFTNWGGHVWDLFANCSGLNQPGFMIYDNLCEALQSYEPKPELSIVDPVLIGACPVYQLDFELHNTGCTPATDFCIRIWEEAFTGDVEHTDPDLLCGLSIGPGEVQQYSVPLPLDFASSPSIRIHADADQDVIECSEAAATGSAVACAPEEGRRIYQFPACEGCVSVPSVFVQPNRTCAGTSVIVDASTSFVAPCVTGIEYAYTGGAVPPPAGATCAGPNDLECWHVGGSGSVITLVDVQQPPGERAITLHVWTRCAENPDCVNEDPHPITIEVHRPPEMAAAAATDIDPCSLAMRLTWDPALFFHDPALGPGTYNVYRMPYSGDLNGDCDAAVDPANVLQLGIDGLSFLDVTTAPNVPYVYVIEAEDRQALNACDPAGPVRGGAVDRLCLADLVGAPAIDEVDLEAPYPGVGNSLRVTNGDPNGATLTWSEVRQDATREFYRVARAVAPQGPFAVISGNLDAPTHDDRGATGSLHFYRVGVVDSCGNAALPSFPLPPQRSAACSNLRLACGERLDATTADCTSLFSTHACDPARDATGADRLHVAWTEGVGNVTFRLDSPDPDLSLIVYDTTLSRCLGWSDTEVAVTTPNGSTRHVVVVDGPAGVTAPYSIEVECGPGG